MWLNSQYRLFQSTDKNKKQKIFLIIRIIIALLLLVLLIDFISFEQIVQIIKQADWKYLAVVIVLAVLNLSLQWYKWNSLLHYGLGEVNKRNSIKSFFIGLTAGSATPARLGEHVGRAVSFEKQKFSNIIVISFIDKLYNILVIVFFGAVGSIVFYKVYFNENFILDFSIIVVILLMSVLFLYLIFSKGVFVEYLKRKISRYGFLNENLDVLKRILRSGINKKVLMLLINISYYLVILLQFALLAKMFSNGTPLLELMLIFSCVLLATTVILPISFGDLGVRESAAAYLITFAGIDSAVGFNSAIFLFIINVIFPALIGAIFLFKK